VAIRLHARAMASIFLTLGKKRSAIEFDVIFRQIRVASILKLGLAILILKI
jgi:hypothetical protein